jgi:N-acetylglucosamine-6-phosphate deacetylase
VPSSPHAVRGTLILPDRLVDDGAVLIHEGRIRRVGEWPAVQADLPTGSEVARTEGFVAPGFVDLHVHGGDGADFMDPDEKAFGRALAAHARHGTTSLLPTSTAASGGHIVRFLSRCRDYRLKPTAGVARVLGAHLYGPYFHPDARGCHPAGPVRPPDETEFSHWLAYAADIATATVAPELAGALEFARACVSRGIRLNVGHSHATFDQVAAALSWGARHVDHLYCAMSDKTKLRASQPYPMRGGVLEATFYFDELTSEVIADGKHLSADLLLLALKIKGPDRLALVTDCNRALDQPEGTYLFGPSDAGEPFLNKDGVGVMPDGKALASSTQGMDHMLRTFVRQTGAPLADAVRMASLTPARIAGFDDQVGSLSPGKLADLVLLDRELAVQRVFAGGLEVGRPSR